MWRISFQLWREFKKGQNLFVIKTSGIAAAKFFLTMAFLYVLKWQGFLSWIYLLAVAGVFESMKIEKLYYSEKFIVKLIRPQVCHPFVQVSSFVGLKNVCISKETVTRKRLTTYLFANQFSTISDTNQLHKIHGLLANVQSLSELTLEGGWNQLLLFWW